VLIFNLCFGLYPHKVLRRELAARLRLSAQGLMGQADTQDLWDELALGVSAQQKRLGWIRLFHLRPAQEQAELDQAILNTYRALLAVAVLRDQHLDNEQATAFAQMCERSAQDIEQGRLPQMDDLPELSASSSLAEQDCAMPCWLCRGRYLLAKRIRNMAPSWCPTPLVIRFISTMP